MVLYNCKVIDCTTSCRLPILKMLTKDRSDPIFANVTPQCPVVKKMAKWHFFDFRIAHPQ